MFIVTCDRRLGSGTLGVCVNIFVHDLHVSMCLGPRPET
jgi:hypothetical protein